MKFVLYNHQGKGNAHQQALVAAGWRMDAEHPDAVLIDHDVGPNGQGWRDEVTRHGQRGVPIYFYPHAARPMVQYDGMYPLSPYVRGIFAIADGHLEVMRRYGWDRKAWTTGWPYCRQRAFQPAQRVTRILFAPIHPNANGWLHESDREANAAAYRLLLGLRNVQITVRYLRKLEANGLWFDRRVRWVQGRPDGSTGEVDLADVVIAHQTLAYIAIARGKPVVMIGDRVCPHSGNLPTCMRWAETWPAYRDYLAYPYDLADVETAGEALSLMERAAESDAEVRVWRERFIGPPFDGPRFAREFTEAVQNGD